MYIILLNVFTFKINTPIKKQTFLLFLYYKFPQKSHCFNRSIPKKLSSCLLAQKKTLKLIFLLFLFQKKLNGRKIFKQRELNKKWSSRSLASK